MRRCCTVSRAGPMAVIRCGLCWPSTRPVTYIEPRTVEAGERGVVFKIDASGNESVLHSFTGGADGQTLCGVILGPEEQLYGATAFGGRANVGVVFEIKPK